MMKNSPFSGSLNGAKQQSREFRTPNLGRSNLMSESKTVEQDGVSHQHLEDELKSTRDQLVYYASNHTVLERKTRILVEKLSKLENEMVDKEVTIELLQEQISMLSQKNETQIVYPEQVQ